MIRTGFTPYHGFNFKNGQFKFYVGPVSCSVLCGGISYAALDYYYKKLRTPDMAKNPAEGNPLCEYLYKRQATAHFYTWNRFAKAWASGVAPEAQMNKEISVLKTWMAAKKPMVICLHAGMGHGHHVLCTGYDDNYKMLELYDSNYPGQTPTLMLDDGGKWYHSGGGGSMWNGWFGDGGFDQEGGAKFPVVPYKFCRDCHGLVCNSHFEYSGACKGGGAHNMMDTEYYLPNDTSGESGWFLCRKCYLMFTPEGDNAYGKCFKGGKHEISTDRPEQSVYHLGRGKGEYGWSRCNACNTLNWSKGAAAACPAGGSHDNSDSERYVVDNRVIEKK
jgi:hypothetical protein